MSAGGSDRHAGPMNASTPATSSIPSGQSDDRPDDEGPARSDPGTQPSTAVDRLHRCRDRRMVAGVAAGLADYFGVDATLVRIGFIVLALLGGLAVPLYLAGWLLIPDEGADYSIAEDLLVPVDPR